MDFLKSAVVSAISKGPAFPYTFGDRVDIGTSAIEESIWELYNGTRKVIVIPSFIVNVILLMSF